MEAIKKSMLGMKKEREIAIDKADALEIINNTAQERLKKVELEHATLTEICTKLEAEYKECSAEFNKTDKLVDKRDWDVNKQYILSGKLMRQYQETDVVCEKSEKNLEAQLEKLEACNKRIDEAGRLNRMMESRAKTDKIRFKELEKQVKELTTKTEEQEAKIEENLEIISIFEEDQETAETKAANATFKIIGLQEELQVVQNNLKSLENSAEQSRLAEIEFLKTIENLKTSCEKMELRAAKGDAHVQKLLRDIDKLSGQLNSDKEKMRSLSFEMEATLSEFK